MDCFSVHDEFLGAVHDLGESLLPHVAQHPGDLVLVRLEGQEGGHGAGPGRVAGGREQAAARHGRPPAAQQPQSHRGFSDLTNRRPHALCLLISLLLYLISLLASIYLLLTFITDSFLI